MTCPICGGFSEPYDCIDRNWSGPVGNGQVIIQPGPGGFPEGTVFFPPVEDPVWYHRCLDCGFLWVPEMYAWTHEDFRERIYNKSYHLRDPGFGGERARQNAVGLMDTFGALGRSLRHLDYGGGDGALSRTLLLSGWDSESWDPFFSGSPRPERRFDLITAYETVEHVPDQHKMADDWASLLANNGTVFFSTATSDKEVKGGYRLRWWYAAPGSGHISLHTYRSLAILAEMAGLNYRPLDEFRHVMWRGRCLLK
jgi:2-polyprenyl-6-hydroxyphenyl methylase/3-demethylubiquinone-9 3-methyltransferase